MTGKIRHVIQRLEDENFEHKQRVIGLASCLGAPVFGESLLDDGFEDFPFDGIVQTDENVTFFVSSAQDFLLVKKSRL
jgi:hypothetical protein